MGDIIIALIVVILMLIVVCIMGSFILTKNIKEFHINFSLKGFDISGSFFENSN